MTVTVNGIYKQGTVQLLETPTGLPEGRVVVTLSPPEATTTRTCHLQYGKYDVGRVSTDDDFRIAEWRGEEGIDGD